MNGILHAWGGFARGFCTRSLCRVFVCTGTAALQVAFARGWRGWALHECFARGRPRTAWFLHKCFARGLCTARLARGLCVGVALQCFARGGVVSQGLHTAGAAWGCECVGVGLHVSLAHTGVLHNSPLHEDPAVRFARGLCTVGLCTGVVHGGRCMGGGLHEGCFAQGLLCFARG